MIAAATEGGNDSYREFRFTSGWVGVIATTALLACGFKITIALRTYGTNDVLFWEQFVRTFQQSGGIAVYHQLGHFNHPPFMLHFLRLLDFAASSTGIPFSFWLRLPGILADAGSIYLVSKLSAKFFADRVSPLVLVILAASPVSLMISGFHGNTDPLMIFFLLLSIYLVDATPHLWIAGAAFGMSLNIKMVPLIAVPVLLLYLPSTRTRFEYFMAGALVFSIGSLPYAAEDPSVIARNVLGYGSIPGHWGITRLLASLPSTLSIANRAYVRLGWLVVLLAIAAVSLQMNRLPQKPPLFIQCGLVISLFMSLTPGFGVQYLAWPVPWVVVLGLRATIVFYIASGMFLFLVYTYWSQGIPWYLANSVTVGDWRGYLVYFEIVCWASVVAMTAMYMSVVFPRSWDRRGGPPTNSDTSPGLLSRLMTLRGGPNSR